MTSYGVLIVVNIPQKEYEEQLKKLENTSNITIEKEKYCNSSKIINKLKSFKDSCVQETNVTISKCKSAESLNLKDKEDGMFRSKSETTIIDDQSSKTESKCCVKSSWDEIKRMTKLSKKSNKLTITRPLKGVDILSAFNWDTPLEIILSELLRNLNIRNVSWVSSKDENFWQVMLSLESDALCEELLEVLKAFGIGVRYQSSLSILPCSLHSGKRSDCGGSDREPILNHSGEKSTWSQLSNAARVYLRLAQLLRHVKAGSILTLDWLLLLLASALITAVGLIENSDIILICGLLFSPLQSSMAAVTLGIVEQNRSLLRVGVLLAALSIFVCLLVGFIYGLTFYSFADQLRTNDWVTDHMLTWSELRSLWVGALVATLTGGSSIIANFSPHKVLVPIMDLAVSALLLPPAVNAGLFWAMALLSATKQARFKEATTAIETEYRKNQATRLSVLGTVSLCVQLVNLTCIFLAGLAVYKLKEECRLKQNLTWWKTKNAIQKTQKVETTSNKPWNNNNDTFNKPDETNPNAKRSGYDPIQSETVTYRRHTPAIRRLRAQNIEAYCLRKAQLGESYMPLDTSEGDVHKQKLDNQDPDKLEDFTAKYNDHYTRDFSRKVSSPLDIGGSSDLYNFLESRNVYNKHVFSKGATIEPSSNYAVDSKKYGPFLDTKSFNV